MRTMLNPGSYRNMFENRRPVVVAGGDGTIIAQNKPARRLMGPGTGQYCWDVMSQLDDTEMLPCREGCVLKLLSVGMDCSQNTQFKMHGQRHQISCIPVNGVVVSTLTPLGSETPKAWQILSPREQEILLLLADGETTSSVADILGVGESTVRTHVERMRSKLSVNTRAAVVAEGFRLGYLD
jgi:DNA-binding CsgD family transcriptional regulator